MSRTLSSPAEDRLRVVLPSPALAEPLGFERTVPRRLVHRASVAEVFVTDGRSTGPGRALVAAQWPRTHALYGPDTHGHSDPLLLVETFRQAGIYVAHRYNDVPLDHRFVFCDLDLRIDDPAALKVGADPLKVVLDTTFTPDPDKPATPQRVQARFTADIKVGGRPCARISGRLVTLASRAYRALRARGAARTAQPAEIRPDRGTPVCGARAGRPNPQNVLLAVAPGLAENTYLLRLDPDHAGYFEHACDHVPGIALTEAFRQAAHLAAPRPTAAEPMTLAAALISFDRFAELDAPVTITVEDTTELPQGHVVRLTATQHGEAVARAGLAHHFVR
ncbi:ScbA/BarX family gamma-butyrolactone biosynthesis protein [Streptomyces sp. NPDC045431]|uniref:ScbA/BarX family gamma-butyrolactone biosynthesis protein n=1 Tax=Streptomyces sp. NPDC045431 TaxID=3155613 RepID=UPI00340EDBB5